MRIVPVEHGLEHLIGQSGGVRGKGVHMSDLYGAYYAELDPKRYGRGGGPNPLVLEPGLAFEEFLERGIVARLGANGGRPGELLTPNGILFNPDLMIYTDRSRLGEIKLTWMSSSEVPRTAGTNGFPPKFDKYFTQMKLYCHALGICEARLIAFFVNGDYSWMRSKKGASKSAGPSPELLAWDIEFTARELREEWDTIMMFAKTKGLL